MSKPDAAIQLVTKVVIQLANKVQFELFGAFLKGSQTSFSTPDASSLRYECALDDYQLLIASTQFKSTVTEV
jgi:hypothetical protein